MLNGQHACAGGSDDVADGVVALEVDEVFSQCGQLFGLSAQLLFGVWAGNEPQLVSLAGLSHARGCRFGVVEGAGLPRCGCCSGGGSFGERTGQAVASVEGADGVLAFDGGGRDESGQLVVPVHAALPLGVQVDVGRQSTGDCEQVGFYAFRLVFLTARGDPHGFEAVFTFRLDHGTAGVHLDTGGSCCVGLRGVGSRIDDGHLSSGPCRIDCSAVGGVVGGEQNDLLSRQHPVATQVPLDRGGEHDSGKVVVCKDQRPVKRSGGEHDFPGDHVPQPLA